MATVDFNGADNLLALGVQPVTVRDWFGEQPRAVWAWGDPLLEGTPTILPRSCRARSRPRLTPT